MEKIIILSDQPEHPEGLVSFLNHHRVMNELAISES
jgi:hypothetical protein